MPNTGKPSKDCHLCRKRRVKCGLERPECARCHKLGVRCPGYREESSVMFRNEDLVSLANSVATKSRKRARSTVGNESSQRNGLSTPQESEVVTDHLVHQLAEMDAIFVENDPSFRPLQADTLGYWREKSPIVVLSIFSAPKDDYRIFGLASFLPRLIFEADYRSCLRLACQAVTLAIVANKTNSPEAFGMRDEAYCAALNAAHTAIGDLKTRQDDGTAITVWLLGVYELVSIPLTQSANPRHSRWKIHVGALTQLLSARGIDQTQTENGLKIFWLLISFVQIKSLALGEDNANFVTGSIEALLKSSQSQNPEVLHLAKYTNETISMVATISEALLEAGLNYDSVKLRNILTDAVKLQAHMEGTVIETLPILPTNAFDAYSNNQYRGCYIRLLQLILDLISTIRNWEFDTENDVLLNSLQQKSINGIRRQAALIFDSLPFILGSKFDAMQVTGLSENIPSGAPMSWSNVLRLLWPLRTISARLHYISDDQVQYLLKVMQYICKNYGIGNGLSQFLMEEDLHDPIAV